MLSGEPERERDRERLIEYQAQANDAYDQTLFKLSGGALALSFVFVRQFVGDGQEARMLWTLGLAWIFWITSLTCVLVAFYIGGWAMDEAVRQQDDAETPDGGIYNTAIKVLNAVGGGAFIVGAALAGLFMISNLEGDRQMQNDKPDRKTTDTGRYVPGREVEPQRLEERARVVPRPRPASQTQTTGDSKGSSGKGTPGGRSTRQR